MMACGFAVVKCGLIDAKSSRTLSVICIYNYTRVNQKFGTESDFDRLVAEAHNRGIKIYLDYVLNQYECGASVVFGCKIFY